MKLTVQNKDFKTALTKANGLLSSKSINPIDTCIGLKADDGYLYFITVGNNINTTVKAPATVEVPGVVYFQASALELLKDLPVDPTTELLLESHPDRLDCSVANQAPISISKYQNQDPFRGLSLDEGTYSLVDTRGVLSHLLSSQSPHFLITEPDNNPSEIEVSLNGDNSYLLASFSLSGHVKYRFHSEKEAEFSVITSLLLKVKFLLNSTAAIYLGTNTLKISSDLGEAVLRIYPIKQNGKSRIIQTLGSLPRKAEILLDGEVFKQAVRWQSHGAEEGHNISFTSSDDSLLIKSDNFTRPSTIPSDDIDPINLTLPISALTSKALIDQLANTVVNLGVVVVETAKSPVPHGVIQVEKEDYIATFYICETVRR